MAAALHAHDIKSHGAGFWAFGADPMADRLLGILRHETFELGLGLLMLEVSLSGAAKDVGEFRPCIRRAHIHDPHRLNAGPRWLDAEEARGLAALHAAPEFLFGRQQEVLVQCIGGYLDLDPLAAEGRYTALPRTKNGNREFAEKPTRPCLVPGMTAIAIVNSTGFRLANQGCGHW
jgi:hypothetical protein